jgi:hypothetical protein
LRSPAVSRGFLAVGFFAVLPRFAFVGMACPRFPQQSISAAVLPVCQPRAGLARSVCLARALCRRAALAPGVRSRGVAAGLCQAGGARLAWRPPAFLARDRSAGVAVGPGIRLLSLFDRHRSTGMTRITGLFQSAQTGPGRNNAAVFLYLAHLVSTLLASEFAVLAAWGTRRMPLRDGFLTEAGLTRSLRCDSSLCRFPES